MDDETFGLLEKLYAEMQKEFRKTREEMKQGFLVQGQKIDVLQTDVAVLKSDVANLKADMKEVKIELKLVKKDVQNVKIQFSELNTVVLKMGRDFTEQHETLESKVKKHEEILLKKAQ